MNINTKLAVFITGLTSVLTTIAAPVSAAVFNFSYSGIFPDGSGRTVNASGVLTTNPYDPTTNTYEITGISGTRNGEAIESLLSPGSLLDNNNLIYADTLNLDEYGFAYSIGDTAYNIFFPIYEVYTEIGYTSNSPFPYSGYIVSSFSITRVPEPSSLLATLGVTVFVGSSAIKRFSRSNRVKKGQLQPERLEVAAVPTKSTCAD